MKLLIWIQNSLKKYSLPILAGIFHGTSYVPFPPWALFFCLVPLWLFWAQSDTKTLIKGTLISLFVGNMIGAHWVIHTAHEFGQLPWILSLLVLMAFAALSSIHYTLAGLTWKFLAYRLRGFHRHLLFPFITALYIAYFPTIFPWNYGHPWIFWELPGVQLADIIGVVGICTLTIFINYFVFLAFFKKNHFYWSLIALFIFVTANTFGYLHLFNIPQTNKSATVMLVQANIGNLAKLQAGNKNFYREKIIEKFVSMTEQKLKELDTPPDLIVWPETAYPSYVNLNNFEVSAPHLHLLTKENKTRLITGFYDFDKNYKVSNAMLYVDSDGLLSADPTHKTILLAFGEYLPGGTWFPWLKKLLPMVSEFKRGPGPQTRRLGPYNIGPLICYEALFPSFSRQLANQNADFLVNLTNDSWYGTTAEPWQHLFITAGRAIETRRPVIRATNTGISTVILETGETLHQSPLHKEWVGVYKFPYHSSDFKTSYQKWGWWLHAFLLLFFTFAITAHGWLKYYNERNKLG